MARATEAALSDLGARPERFPAALLLTASSEARLERESRRLAARLLCPGDDPEGRCGSCRRVASGLHPDFLSIEPEGVQIRIDRIREALVFGAGRPYEGALRVARLLRADQLGVEAGNALLKSLEEPGERFRWILTSVRPECLLTTIRSRCTPAALPEEGSAARHRAWQSRGFSPEDARDLALFATDDEDDPPARLVEGRALRAVLVAALEEGLVAGRLAALPLLAELVASSERRGPRILAELLADAALAVEAPPSESIRHHPVSGKLAQLARYLAPGALREAAVYAADPPADNRRGNRRLHYEKLLLDLFRERRA